MNEKPKSSDLLRRVFDMFSTSGVYIFDSNNRAKSRKIKKIKKNCVVSVQNVSIEFVGYYICHQHAWGVGSSERDIHAMVTAFLHISLGMSSARCLHDVCSRVRFGYDGDRQA